MERSIIEEKLKSLVNKLTIVPRYINLQEIRMIDISRINFYDLIDRIIKEFNLDKVKFYNMFVNNEKITLDSRLYIVVNCIVDYHNKVNSQQQQNQIKEIIKEEVKEPILYIPISRSCFINNREVVKCFVGKVIPTLDLSIFSKEDLEIDFIDFLNKSNTVYSLNNIHIKLNNEDYLIISFVNNEIKVSSKLLTYLNINEIENLKPILFKFYNIKNINLF